MLFILSICTRALEGCESSRVFSPTGDSFLSMSSDIEEAYKEFLANYTQVTTMENAYKQKEALWTEIVAVIKTSA